MTAQTILPANSASGGYNVTNSLRGTRGDSNYLSRTFETGDRDKWTWSTWLKKNSNGNVIALFSSWADSNNNSVFNFTDEDTLQYHDKAAGSTQAKLVTNRKFRDVSAWYHIVLTYDSGNGTSGNRIRLYINGEEETDFSTDTMPGQNNDSTVNRNCVHYLGTDDNTGYYLDCYLAEVRFVDGSALDPTSFGEFDEDSPLIWKPKSVSSLTNGTNGFYLQFKQTGTSQNSSGLGADTSGEDHHFAVTNFAAIDQTTDTCTNNFSTMNVLDNYYFGGTFSQGNLKVASDAGVEGYATNTMPVSTGKWYWEMKINSSGSNRDQIGIADKVIDDTDFSPISGNNRYEGYYGYTGNHYSPDTGNNSYGATFTTGDIVGVALDLDNHKLYFYKNGAIQNSGDPTSGSTGTGAISVETDPHDGVYYATFANIHNTASTFEANFGNPTFSISSGNSDANGYGNFEYAVPSGYFSLCTKNLAEYG
jgi:hypothetical protein